MQGVQGPFVGGEKISSVDLSLAPKLYHLKIALGHYKQWSIPGDLTYLLKYIEVRIPTDFVSAFVAGTFDSEP